MKKLAVLGLLFVALVITGCDKDHNFMDVDNPNAKDDLMSMIGSGNISGMNMNNIVPDSLSGAVDTAKGYVNKYYSGFFSEYMDKAREALSGVRQSLRSQYNNLVDELNKMISDKVSGAISGELNKFKMN